MADSESDLETDGLESALDTLCHRHCGGESSPKSKDYCSEFCELVADYTGQWQVPLPQLKVLRTALCSFTKATAAFPDDCQHIHYVLSSLALSFFELMLFFSKEEFVEDPLKDILDSFQCHTQLLRHRNGYFQQVKQIIKAGGPWENQVLQRILKEADLPPKEVEEYLSSELPIFLELRVRYLQACERIKEGIALAKSCLENREAGKHLYFHQAYLTCLHKASLHEHLQKEMKEINGRDAVEIICNTESVEKDELLLSLCKAFLTQHLLNGDMYYIWDLVFIWSRLHLRAHPSRQGFLAECLKLASSATNVRAIFPFIKLVTTEVGGEGIQVCVELCARALQLCDMKADSVTQSLVCKTIAFLLPHDLEICRACALLVFCQERSVEAYRTVCLLYMHPDQEPHPHNSPVRTNVRFHILQMLKERLCFDPEFWNLLTLRTHCLELISDKVMKAAVLNEMKEEENEFSEELSTNRSNDSNESSTQGLSLLQCTEATCANQDHPKEQVKEVQAEKSVSPTDNAPLKKRKWRRRLRKRKNSVSDDEADPGDDPEIKYNLKSTALGNKPIYSLRRNHTDKENSVSAKFPLNRKREYLSRCVKSQILKRKGRKKRWLQGLPRLEPVQPVTEKKVKYKGKKRGRKPLLKLEVSYPDNEMVLTEDESGFEEKMVTEHTELEMPHLENELEQVKSKKTWKDRVLRTQQYAHLSHHCNICRKDYKGLNIMRHALSHLKSRKLRCILCGKRFKQLSFAKKHVLDHFDEMCKQKPPDKDPCTEDKPATNGVGDGVENPNQPLSENRTTILDEETPQRKPGGKAKVSSLRREDRIIRNLRTLIKKTSVLHKKCKNPDANIFKQVEFKDEQVVIENGLVIVKDPSVIERHGEGEGEESPVGENGFGVDITYHLCPSESCDRVFLKVSTTLTKHAIKCHINEEKVLEKTFIWAKHKCSLCFRQLQFLQNYKDHMKLHNNPLQHFCYHLDCNHRFLTQQELKDHVVTHQPFRPQCPFTDCEKLFSSLQGLYDHEWRHYIPAPQKEEQESGAGRQIKQNAEAPWKQRVKVEELWLQSKKAQRDSPTPDCVEASDLEEISKKNERDGEGNVPNSGEDLSKSDDCSEKSQEPTDDSNSTINGYEDRSTSTSHAGTAAATSTRRCQKKPSVKDPLNVRDIEDSSTLAEGVQQRLGEPHITEHKTFRPEDPSYATFVKAPFIRPPPSTYLDESLLSMRKRRTTEEAALRKNVYWCNKKKKELEQETEQPVENVVPEQKVRQRCDKCLSSFSSLEELKKHQALNTCSALFGFDSDDDSKHTRFTG
ncbi:hypothetical protein F2P81_021017 [Scophthalmus maximus]|uniref:C2H2-type domain-containing protein n=1 Tax=Scophthalmus maximus TaxID=52904 RepID=A0A6A4S3R0_SCOMX|nr:hypothetical protein F2P81_021017 [Scophthalmus maximus]